MTPVDKALLETAKAIDPVAFEIEDEGRMFDALVWAKRSNAAFLRALEPTPEMVEAGRRSVLGKLKVLGIRLLWKAMASKLAEQVEGNR